MSVSARSHVWDEIVPLLRCPACGSTVTLGETVECSSGHVFPIERGVPRLLAELWGDAGERELVAETSAAFGDQWTELGEQAGVTQSDLALHLPRSLALQDISGMVLDAGCGMGRYAALVASLGAKVVGLDVSRAVDKAAELWPGVPFVQGDIVGAPFAERSFDVVYSFGVLHHLPDPLRGYRACAALVKPGGLLLVWVYSEHGGALRLGRRAARTLVRRNPALLRPLALAAAVLLAASYLRPRRLLGQRDKKLGFYDDKGFGQFYTDCFDALSAPAEVYLDAADCRAWLDSIEKTGGGFERRADGSGWIIWARR